jgi:hypothetical protein
MFPHILLSCLFCCLTSTLHHRMHHDSVLQASSTNTYLRSNTYSPLLRMKLSPLSPSYTPIPSSHTSFSHASSNFHIYMHPSFRFLELSPRPPLGWDLVLPSAPTLLLRCARFLLVAVLSLAPPKKERRGGKEGGACCLVIDYFHHFIFSINCRAPDSAVFPR